MTASSGLVSVLRSCIDRIMTFSLPTDAKLLVTTEEKVVVFYKDIDTFYCCHGPRLLVSSIPDDSVYQTHTFMDSREGFINKTNTITFPFIIQCKHDYNSEQFYCINNSFNVFV